MTPRAIPAPDAALQLLRDHFFTRTDRVALQTPGGKPFPHDVNGQLDELLTAHLLGDEAPEVTIRYASTKRSGVARGRFRVGSYTPAPGGKTRWLCIDLDGKGHAAALADPTACAQEVLRTLASCDIPAHLERSGGGNGWHIWVLFEEPIAARKARSLAFALLPSDAALADGGTADARRGRGIEVFPKQSRHRGKKKLGNLVWLPWWAGAAPGGNQFYRLAGDGELVPFVPEALQPASEAAVDRVLELVAQLDQAEPETPAPPAAGTPEWRDWRQRALAALPLESVYGRWLTGQASSAGWLECRDPDSASGDRNPSAGVADGTGEAERGAFHSFISGETISVFDFLMRHDGAADMSEATRRVADLSGVAPPSGTGREPQGAGGSPRYRPPEIQVNNRQMRAIVDDAWGALDAAGQSSAFSSQRPFLFLRSGELVRLRRASAVPHIEAMDEPAAFGLLARVADWVRVTDDAIISVPPVRDVARDLIAYPDPQLPVLEAVVTSPVFGRRGGLIRTPGYHPRDQLWLHPDRDLTIEEIPEAPAQEDVHRARDLLLDDLLVDFPFVDKADRAHAVAALVLPFVRRMINGCTPLHLIEAPTAGSGKGLLANLVSVVTTGAASDARTLPGTDDEVRKMLTAELARARPLILLDNASERRMLDSSVLASAVTADTWTDRLLGQSKMLSLPNRALWMITGNNPRLSMEIARRCIRIRIDPGVDRPWLRSDFRHEHPLEWVRENRARLVHAVLVLIQSWVCAGRPLGETRLGSFERWSAVVGGILEHAGIPGFLTSLDELYEAADAEGQMWRAFTAAWWTAFGDTPKQVGELNDLCEDRSLMMRVRGEGNLRSQQIRLGKALSRARDRVFDGLRIEGGRLLSGYTMHALRQVSEPTAAAASTSCDLLDLEDQV